ncbi:MAG: laccase domain-containing protein [Candidatus Pacebacteria bacterium]|nr:laccase domain-containing protein [Candidatus Paceibacterota bacterium]
MSIFQTVKPTLSIPIFDGEVSVHGFGRNHGLNFSFKGIDTSASPHTTHGHILKALAGIGCNSDFFAPSPIEMNAEVVNSTAMWAHWQVFLDDLARRKLYRGAKGDGFSFINEWNSYAVSAADCALVVVKNGDHIIAAHAGRNSVIDMERMKGNKPRKNESVVHAIRNVIERAGGVIRDTQVWVGFSISPGPHFAHAISDEKNPHNRQMVDYISREYGSVCFDKQDGQDGALGWLDNKELIRQQFLNLGVRGENIELDSVCTYSDKDAQGEYLWYSNKRQLIVGKEQYRNLFAVVKTVK